MALRSVKAVSLQRRSWRSLNWPNCQHGKLSSKLLECAYPFPCYFTLFLFASDMYSCSIYLVHDDAKEKEFELEMSWIGDETDGIHLPVPKELFEEAEGKAKAALENFE